MSGLFKELCDNLVRLPNVVSAGTYHIYVGGWVLNEVGEIALQKLLHHPWSTPCVNGKDKSNTRIGGGLYVLSVIETSVSFVSVAMCFAT